MWTGAENPLDDVFEGTRHSALDNLPAPEPGTYPQISPEPATGRSLLERLYGGDCQLFVN